MSSSVNHRHQSPAKQKVTHRKKGSHKKAVDSHQPAGKLLAFTIDADTAHVVKFETLDARGVRRELTDEEKTSLLREGGEGRFEDVLERAFEAGIACALGDEAKQDRADETTQDAELRHLLLARLIEHSAVKHLMDGDLLDRAILDALIRHSITPAADVGARGRRGSH
jgi:hypothetical protein